ncbi:hypothetical protein PM082_016781 [Marasmius tenuissimus]|nr:hypothetical protein PM082_016781 [Marasmius tenuissimus]
MELGEARRSTRPPTQVRTAIRTVVGNIWAVMHDKTLYGPDVESFNPDRFIRTNGNNPPHPEQYAFGSGRRVCPGKNFAINSLYLTISNILARYTIMKLLNENGIEYSPEVEYTDNGTSYPKSFKCRFIPGLPRQTGPSRTWEESNTKNDGH